MKVIMEQFASLIYILKELRHMWHEDAQKVLSSEPFPKLTVTHTQLSGQVPHTKVQMHMSCGALLKLVILLILYICDFHRRPQLNITKSHSLGSW